MTKEKEVRLGGAEGVDLRDHIISGLYVGGFDDILVISTDKGDYMFKT